MDQSLAFFRHPSEGWSTDNKRVKKLLGAGITNYLDLTEVDELLPYETLFNREAELIGMTINYKRVPIKDQNITTSAEMAKCMLFINESIKSGNKVYIHCLRGLGRTGMAVGCFLVEEGLTGKQALKKITSLRKNVLNSVLPSPQNKKQSGVVENWKNIL